MAVNRYAENKLHFSITLTISVSNFHTLEFEPDNLDVPEVIEPGIPEDITDTPVLFADVVFNKAIDPVTFTLDESYAHNPGRPT